MAPRQHQRAEKDPNGNAARGPDPIVVEGILQKKRNTNEHGEDADPIEPMTPDEVFQMVWRHGLGSRHDWLGER